jgi:hypothetical protein
MKALKNRWSFLIVGLLLGAYTGGYLALHYSNSREREYDHVLEDSYVERQIWTIITSTSTIEKAEKAEVERILSDHQILLRSAFLTLVELHKSGHYKRKEADIRKFLGRAKKFMEERPKGFIDVELVPLTPEGERSAEPPMLNASGTTAGAIQARESLQGAFDYVDSLSDETKETNSEHGEGGKASPATS